MGQATRRRAVASRAVCEAGTRTKKRDAATRPGPARRARQAELACPDHAVGRPGPAWSRSSWSPPPSSCGRSCLPSPCSTRPSRWSRSGPAGPRLTPPPPGSCPSRSSRTSTRPGPTPAAAPPVRGRLGGARQAAGPLVRAVPHASPGPCSGRYRPASSCCASGRTSRSSAWSRPSSSPLAVLGWRLAKGVQDERACTAAGPEHARPARSPGTTPARTSRPGRTSPERPAGRRPRRRPRLQRPGPGRGAALRRTRRPRPPGPAPAAAAADLGRGRHGRAGRDDRAGPGQGAGPLDRRLDRGGPAARRGRGHHREADAALRLPRARPAPARPPWPGSLAKIFYAFGLLPDARGHRGAPGRPGRGVPRRDRDQDQRADRLRAGRRAVHRRGVQPGQRGRRAARPVRQRGGPDAAQAGRGRPREPRSSSWPGTRSRWRRSWPPTPAWPPGSPPG